MPNQPKLILAVGLVLLMPSHALAQIEAELRVSS